MLSAQVTGHLMGYAPRKAEVTEFSAEGEDRSSELETFEKEFIFEKEVEFDTGFGPDPDEDDPTETLRQTLDFSSVGFHLGIRIILD